jgi:FkbM family methyltransferase
MTVSTLRAATVALGVQSEFLIKHFPKVGVVKSRLPNGRILSLSGRADDWVSNQVYWLGWRGYEPEMSPLFFQFAAKARIIFDVGAHVGFYALVAGHANAAAKVFAFEPVPATFERLARNMSLNRLSNVTCMQCAVGNRDGLVPFYKGEQKIPCSAGTSFEFYKPWASMMSTIQVTSVTVDRFLEEKGLTGIDLVKVDTESTEPEVLHGMANSIKRDRPTIFCEVLAGFRTEQQIEDLLKPFGYRFYMLTTTGPVRRDHIDADTKWPNHLLSVLGDQEIDVLYHKQVGSQRI